MISRKKRICTGIGILVSLLMSATLFPEPSLALEEERAIGTFNYQAKLLVSGKRLSSAVRGSIRLSRDKSGLIRLEELQFWGRSFKVPLQKGTAPSGALSFRMSVPGPSMNLDNNGNFSTNIEGTLHYPLIDRMKGFRSPSLRDSKLDDYGAFTEKMKGTLKGQLLFKSSKDKDSFNFNAQIILKPRDQALFKPIMVDSIIRFRGIFVPPLCACVGRRLCIQPVGVKSSATDPSPTGTALAALKPGAVDIWKRVCVAFEWRPIMYVINSNWKTITAGAQEETDLRNSVNVDDCIEVFFIEHWSPEDANGGGATYSGGEAGSKIITSDDNDNDIDLLHLAHELGHVLDLKHPGTGCPSVDCPDRVDGSSGTVICPSGYENDNPDVQSEENGELGNNPLTVPIVLLSCPDPDCTDSADCGACP